MKNSRFLLILMMILPWFTVSLLGGKTIKRFLPATIFIAIIVKITNIFAKKRKWWSFYSSIHPKISGDIPFILGPYFLTTLWSLKLTYGKFLLFMITNTITHVLFAFPGMNLLKRLGIVSLVRLKPIQLVFILSGRALLLYGFQFLKEKIERIR